MDPITLLILLAGSGFVLNGVAKKRAAVRAAAANAPRQPFVTPDSVSAITSDPGVLPSPGLVKPMPHVAVSIAKAIVNQGVSKVSSTAVSSLTGAAGGAVGGAGAAYLFAGGVIGGQITQDWAGQLAGQLAPTTGNIANVGRVLGRALDRFFGGDGTSGTGIVMQVTGFVGGLAVGVFGLMALPLFGQVIAIVAGIGAAFSDNARLAWGQAGVIAETKEAAKAFFDKTLPELRQKVLDAYGIAQLAPEDEYRTQCFALAYTIGFINEENQAKYRVHMAKPKGWFVGDHRQWAVDRGVFVENMSIVIDGLYMFVSPLPMPTVPPSGRALPPMQFVSWLATTPDGKAFGLQVRDVALAGKKLYMDVVGAYNSDAGHCQDRGRFLSNMMHYIQSMAETWGVGASAKSHAEHWRDVVQTFTAKAIDRDGNLIDSDFIVFWKASLAENTPFMLPAPKSYNA